MIKYAVLEIGGKQYKFTPNVPVEVDLQGDGGLVSRVLMVVEEDKLKLGKPVLDEKLKLKNLGNFAKDKIRVAKFHAKANFRRVTGSRRKITRLILEA